MEPISRLSGAKDISGSVTVLSGNNKGAPGWCAVGCYSIMQCRIMFSKGCNKLMERVRGASPGCRCKLKSKNLALVMSLFTPIKQEGKFMEHFLSTYDHCTTFFINIFYFNGLDRVQSGCRFGCINGAAVVQAPLVNLTCTTTKQHNYNKIISWCKGAGR